MVHIMTNKQEIIKINKDTEYIKSVQQELIDEIIEEQDEEFEQIGNDEDYIIDIDKEFYK